MGECLDACPAQVMGVAFHRGKLIVVKVLAEVAKHSDGTNRPLPWIGERVAKIEVRCYQCEGKFQAEAFRSMLKLLHVTGG